MEINQNLKKIYEGELKCVDKKIADIFKDSIGFYRTGEPTLMQLSMHLAKIILLLERRNST